MKNEIFIPIYNSITLSGEINIPAHTKGWVIFVHGSGSSQYSPRNKAVARSLNKNNYATLLFDLLTLDEDLTYRNRFDIGLLAWRTQKVTEWFLQSDFYQHEPVAYFGASTGAAAALVASSMEHHPCPVFTIISRGGRPDLAGVERLRKVNVPVLLIVGASDPEVVKLNRYAHQELPDSRIVLVRGATHLFEEAGALEEVMRLTNNWLDEKLPVSFIRDAFT